MASTHDRPQAMRGPGIEEIRRVFLVGCPRGGTTIVQSLLVQALPLASLWETAFFRSMYGDLRNRKEGRKALYKFLRNRLGVLPRERRRLALRTLDDMAREFGITAPGDQPVADNARVLTERFEWLFSEYARMNNCLGWIEKSPNHVFYIDEIERYIRDARFIHLVRDGTDTVASLLNAGRRFRGKPGHSFPTDVEQAVLWWNAATSHSLSRLGQPNHLVLAFHEFLQDTGAAIQRCARFLGLESGSRAGTLMTIAKSAETWKSDAVTGEVKAPEDHASRILGPEERAYIETNLLKTDWRGLLSSAQSDAARPG